MKLEKLLKRETDAIPCPYCNGWSDKVDCTKEEIKSQKCNRRYECCVAAYICRCCGLRIVAELEAPEASW